MNKKSTRQYQESYTGIIRPKVQIISHTTNPIGTLFVVWHGTRYKETFNPQDIQDILRADSLYIAAHLSKEVNTLIEQYPEYIPEGVDRPVEQARAIILKVVHDVIEADVPASEAVEFCIQIDDANVAWREQLVRGRIHQQFWTMSTRILDMTTMDVNMSESIQLLGGDEAVRKYEDTVEHIRHLYSELVKMGIPMEDIRLQPQQHTHRVFWMVPLRTLITIINKRCDWLTQASLWTPINAGVVSELRRILGDSLIRDFIGKPMASVARDIDGSAVVIRHFMTGDNEDRYYGKDPIPVDPLWLAFEGVFMPDNTNIEFYNYMKSMFIQIWDKNYLEVLGWDRDNPDKIGPYDRPYSYYENSGFIPTLKREYQPSPK